MVLVDNASQDTTTLAYVIQAKNAGRITAEDVALNLDVIVGTDHLPVSKFPAKKRSLIQGEMASVYGSIVEPHLSLVRQRKIVLTVYYTFSYHWRGNTESGCGRAQYDPKNNIFLDWGEQCPPK